ncbi:PKD domain-containing protein [Hymenobacter sp.]|uniref:PKD domain-containing protein n=1 Tax=Hymenobacter sp. TaxID=1898978 RepID=UPI00286A056E|nr:PKD domain-containing protein [Hymenobacter sp.]
MNNIRKGAVWALLAGTLLLASCKKEGDDSKLEGPVPQSSFTFQANTTEFPAAVSFTSTSQDGFLYQWDFGDNSRASGDQVTHAYTRGGTYEVSLISAGRGGTSLPAKQNVTVGDACANAAFSKLVDCAGSGTRVWAFSGEPEAIVRETAAGVRISASDTLPACQLNDQFTFSNGFTINYESAGETFQGTACGASRSYAGTYTFRPNAGGNPQIVLQTKGAFVGLTDSVANKTYDILEATDTRLRLRGTNADGTRTTITYAPYDATAPIRLLLTGGTSKTWVLDNTVAAPIVVGTEASPSTYFGGVAAGALPACQSDDEYTFSAANVYTYDAKAETFSANGFSCQAPQSGTSPLVLGPAVGTGLAQFTLSRAGAFIGTTDASPTERVYRILSIDAQKMTLRAGSGSAGGTVFTFKLVAK